MKPCCVFQVGAFILESSGQENKARRIKLRVSVCDALPEFLAQGKFTLRLVEACRGKRKNPPWTSCRRSTYLHELPDDWHTVTWTQGAKRQQLWKHVSVCQVDGDLLTPGPPYLCWWGNQRHNHHPLPEVLQRATVLRCTPNPARTDRSRLLCGDETAVMKPSVGERTTLECGKDSLK